MIKTFSLIETSVNQTNFLLIHIEVAWKDYLDCEVKVLLEIFCAMSLA